MNSGRILVIGSGEFGTSILERLWEFGTEVVLLDADKETVETFRDRVDACFVGDATNPEVLENLDLKGVSTAIVTWGEDFEASVLSVATLKKLQVNNILARATTERQAAILKTVGASRVIRLESEMGQRVATDLTTPISDDLLELAQSYRIVPWAASGPLVGQTLAEAGFRSRYRINVIGYRRRQDGQRQHLSLPTAEYRIGENDTLMLVGEEDDVNRFVEEVGE